MPRPMLRIEIGPDCPRGRVTNLDTGQAVPGIRQANVTIDAHGGIDATLTVALGEVDATTAKVRWKGLERVPVEALRAELARREQEPRR